MKDKIKLVRLTKLEDLRFKGNHPNDINEGSIHIGVSVREPKVGERFYIGWASAKYHQRGLVTSIVEEILDGNKFRTENSIYLLEEITEEDAEKQL